MESFSPTDLKSILFSKRANIYYLEHCKVLVNGGRVEYLCSSGKQSAYWNIPIANTSVLLLGTGTSITQAAVRELSKAGVPIGFCGGNGTPLYSASDHELPILWFLPQSEYRPTQYVQAWMDFWPDESRRLSVARYFQIKRLEKIKDCWTEKRLGSNLQTYITKLHELLSSAAEEIKDAESFTALLLLEARFSRKLYAFISQISKYGTFTREKSGKGQDLANRFLNHGNYLAYGLAATAAWVLGIPHAFAVMHGKTRRGGLVFDIADLIKDAIIMPEAFLAAMRGDSERDFRANCISSLTQTEALDFMLDTLKEAALSVGKLS